MSRKAVVAHTEVQGKTALDGPGVLHKDAGVIHVGLYGERGVINEHVEGVSRTTVELFLNTLIHGVEVWVESASYLKPRLQVVCSSPAVFVIGGASRELPHPGRIYESKRRSASFRRERRIGCVDSSCRRAWGVREREHLFVPAKADVGQQVGCNLGGPQTLKNVGGLDLQPTSFWRYKLEARVAAIKAILLIVEPNQADLVLRVGLPVEAQRRVGLVVNVHAW